MLIKILPDCKEYEDIVKVCHTEGMHLKLYSDIQNTETVLGFESQCLRVIRNERHTPLISYYIFHFIVRYLL